MNRLLILLLCFTLVLSGCAGSPQVAIPTETTSLPSETAETEPIISETELYAVSVPAVTETYQSEDGTILFSSTAQHIQLILPNEEIADSIVLDFLNRVDASTWNAEGLLLAAQNDYDPDEEWFPYFHHVVYSPTRIDQGVLSFWGSQTSYSGGLHGSLNCVAANYDLATGDYLTLGSIMHMDATVDDFIAIIVDMLHKTAEDYSLYDDFEDGVYARLSGDENLYEDFYFTQTGLCFFFDPYEIAPYASGVISVEIPYHELTGLIYDGYFPEERELVHGTMHTGKFMETDMERFNNMAEIILSTGEDIMVVYPEGSVEDIRIRMEGDGMSRPEYTVFAAMKMSDLNAAVISLRPEEITTITISYTANGEHMTVPLE